MFFNSVLFLFYFLPFFISLYLLFHVIFHNEKLRFILLIIASIVFYGWSVGIACVVLLFCAMLCFLLGMGMFKWKRKKKAFLVFGICVLISILAYYKYNPYVGDLRFRTLWIDKSPFLLELTKPRALLLGVSFFTFTGISYLVECYRKPKRTKLLPFLAFFFFFPKLLQGPIARWSESSASFVKPKMTVQNAFYGIVRFIFGLFKKVVLADGIGVIVTAVFGIPATVLTGATAWIGMISYAFQIYLDFSGYTDMAIGLALILGIKIPENFHTSYLSTSVTDFWNRWHMTLSHWLRDYVYIPLGGNRKGPCRTLIHIFIVFVISGLWHGTGLQYLVWGVYHGIAVMTERIVKNKIRFPVGITIPATFLFVMIGWVFFRSPSVPYALRYILSLLPARDFFLLSPKLIPLLDISNVVLLIVSTLIIFLFDGIKSSIVKRSTIYTVVVCGLGSVILFIYTLAVLSASSFTPFLYFQY